ncbi:hypothetical protein [Saccharopolyspora elongata]|uniref:hypothetical protein n=1 Tax=Saccharopolyspora elongata TaxID=2530387 RepID=UPI0014049979|nr:hypothetical protein [Saccharopolyspora elongata]
MIFTPFSRENGVLHAWGMAVSRENGARHHAATEVASPLGRRKSTRAASQVAF